MKTELFPIMRPPRADSFKRWLGSAQFKPRWLRIRAPPVKRDRPPNREPALPRPADPPLRWTTDAQQGVTPFQEPLGNGVEHLLERRVANPHGAPRQRDRQAEPLTHERNVPSPEERHRERLHRGHVRCQLGRVIPRTRS